MNMAIKAADISRRQGVSPEVQHQLEEFLTDYCHTLDDDNLEHWPSYFDARGVYEITTRENVAAGMPLGIMLCEGVGMLEDRIKALRTANIFEAQTYVHITARPQIWEESRDRYALRSNFTVYRTMYTGAVELFALGKYLDVIAVVDGAPRFLKRQVVLDPRRIDTLLVIPL